MPAFVMVLAMLCGIVVGLAVILGLAACLVAGECAEAELESEWEP